MQYQIFREITDDLLDEVRSYRFERKSILKALEPPKKSVIVLKGLRGVGKTTALLQFLLKQKNQPTLYVAANSTLIEQTKLIEIAKEFKIRGGGYLVFDEIHKYPDWEKEVLDITNFYTNVKLIISGSSSLQIDHHLADLSRRHIMVEAHGLSFREWSLLKYGVKTKPHTLSEITKNSEEICFSLNEDFKKNKLSIVSEFHTYLKEGYFPTRDNYPSLSLYYQSLKNTLNAIIDQDISSRFPEITESTKHSLKRLLGIIAQQCPFVPNISALKESLNIGDDKTVKRYLYMLNEGKAIHNLYQKDRSYKDIPKPQKVYLENTNFMYALLENINIGNLRETFAASMLEKIGKVNAPKHGDLIFDDKYTFEIGGQGKRRKQIKNVKDSYVLNDNIDYANKTHLPLWILGFLW